MKNILVIDPSIPFAQYVKLVLNRLGYGMTHAATMKNGFEIIKNGKPDLIISEMVFGHRSGIELCDTLQSNPQYSSIPIIIITSETGQATRSAAQKVGCGEYVTKPVTARIINDLMQRHLPFHHKRENLRALLTTTAEVTLDGDSFKIKTVSVGEGGLYLSSNRPFPEGTVIEIDLPLPGLRSPINLKGQVVYVLLEPAESLPSGMGVQFIDLDHNVSTFLRFYMESYLTDFLPESPSS